MTTATQLELQLTKLSASYASARAAGDWEGCSLIRAKYLATESALSEAQNQ